MNKDWIMLIGTPGVGKSTVAKALEKYGYHYYEADEDLLPEVKELNRNNKGLTPELRDRQHDYLFRRIKEMISKHNKLVVAYDFMWDRYRIKLISICPDLRWVLLSVDKKLLLERVNRPGHLLTPEFALEIAELYEPPSFHLKTVNNDNSVEDTVLQILNC